MFWRGNLQQFNFGAYRQSQFMLMRSVVVVKQIPAILPSKGHRMVLQITFEHSKLK